MKLLTLAILPILFSCGAKDGANGKDGVDANGVTKESISMLSNGVCTTDGIKFPTLLKDLCFSQQSATITTLRVHPYSNFCDTSTILHSQSVSSNVGVIIMVPEYGQTFSSTFVNSSDIQLVVSKQSNCVNIKAFKFKG
jgi:hypothetical protein